MNLKVPVVLLLIAIFIPGCATQPGNVPRQLADAAPEDAGTVFGSIGVGMRTPYDAQSIHYRKVGTRYEAGIVFSQSNFMGVPSGTPADFQDGRVKGSIFAMELPAGTYELFDVGMFHNHGMGSTTFRAEEKFSIQFPVRAGAATYLGEFLTYSTRGRNLFGIPIPYGGYFVVTNKLDRDLEILLTRGYELDREDILLAVDDVLESGVPFFQSEPLPTHAPREQPATMIADAESSLSVEEIQKILDAGDGLSLRNEARALYNQQVSDRDLLDLLAQRLWQEKDNDDDVMVDAMAWFCRVLGGSGDTRYRTVLDDIANDASTRKLRRFAKAGRDNLPHAETEQFRPD